MWNPIIDVLFSKLEGVKRSGDTGNKWMACCPAHEDLHQSLRITLNTDTGKVSLTCYVGCSIDSLISTIGIDFFDLYIDRNANRSSATYPRIYHPSTKKSQKEVTLQELEKCKKDMEADPDCPRGVARFAQKYSVSPQSLWDYGCRWNRIDIYPKRDDDPGELWCPEYDGDGVLVGWLIRDWNGRKSFYDGGHRGLAMLSETPLGDTGPLFLVEGHSDASAMRDLGLSAIGRPSNNGGISQLAKMLLIFPLGREIIVIGENDRKSNGNWPGRSGAESTARQLSELLKRPVRAALVPEPFKDTREWYQSPAASTGNPADIYYRSLVFFADFPEKLQEVTEEELEVATISAKAHSDYAHPEETCPRPGHMALRHLQRGNLRHTLNRCGSSACPNCFSRKKRLRWESLCRHYDALAIHPNTGLHTQTRTFTKKEWDTCRRTLIRRRCQFIRFRLPGDQFVLIATGEFSGSSPLSFADAPAFTKDAIDRAIVSGPGKPFFTSSKQWAMVREKTERQYQKIGNVRIPPQIVRRIAARLGIKYKLKRPADSSLLLVGDFEVIEDKTKEEELIRLLTSKPDMSELYIYSMDDSDNSPSNEYFYRCLPKGIDTMFAWMMDPTG